VEDLQNDVEANVKSFSQSW